MSDLDRKLFEIELDVGDLMEELWATHPAIADKLLPIMEKLNDLQTDVEDAEEQAEGPV